MEPRVALEAAGSAASFGSDAGQEYIARLITDDNTRPDLRMEAVLILIELGRNDFVRQQLKRIVTNRVYAGHEIRQAAVWGLGKTGLKYYEDLLPFIDDTDENVALHAIAAFGHDTPRDVIDRLVQDLLTSDPRRSSAASEALRGISSEEVLRALVQAADAQDPVPEWIIATLGRLRPSRVRAHLADSPLLARVLPMLLIAEEDNWLASEQITDAVAFLRKQNLY